MKPKNKFISIINKDCIQSENKAISYLKPHDQPPPSSRFMQILDKIQGGGPPRKCAKKMGPLTVLFTFLRRGGPPPLENVQNWPA